MARKNPKVDAYLKAAERWPAELRRLRKILLDFPLNEEVKWGKPCYTFERSNLILLYSLKEHCALGFLKGALLKDASGILIKPGEHSQSARWVKFSSVADIAELEPVLRTYIQEAIDAQQAGLKVDFKEKDELVYAEELQQRLDEDPALRKAFEALTPGRRRGYNLFFSAARQSRTRESRIDKCTPGILAGKGLRDR